MTRQRQKADCGIGAVATTTGKSYSAVRAAWRECRSFTRLNGGMDEAWICELLEQVTGQKYEIWEAADWNRASTIKRFRFRRFPERGAVAIAANPLRWLSNNETHALAIVDGKFVDPASDDGSLTYEPEDRVVAVIYPTDAR